MNAKLTILLISAALGSAAGVGIAINAGWGLIGALLLYGVGGSLSLFAGALLVYAAEVAHHDKAAHA